jgi:hypothetical protein
MDHNDLKQVICVSFARENIFGLRFFICKKLENSRISVPFLINQQKIKNLEKRNRNV